MACDRIDRDVSRTYVGPVSIGPNRRNYYRILYVQPGAPHAVLKSSYRALMLSLEMHPDRGGEHWNAALINEAYGVLSDPTKRAEYDLTLDLAWHVGKRQTAGRDPSSEFDAEPYGRSAPSGIGDLLCLFCGAETPDSITTGVCPTCRSPLTPAGASHLEASGRRAARRIANDGDIAYFVDWPQPAPGQGRIVDLSPGGLRFVSSEPIKVHQIIKLEGSLLDAVARVATCRESDGSWEIGVQFYTVRFHQFRGTFLSTTA